MAKLTENTIRALQPKASRYDVRDSEHKGLVLRIAPTGRKSWSLSYRNAQGKQQRFTLGAWPTVKLDKARNLATQKLGAVAGGTDIAAERREVRQREEAPTLKEFVEGAYGDYVKAHHKSHKSTMGRLESTFPWGNRRLDLITPKLVEGWRTRRINAGTEPSTVNRDVDALKPCLNKAVEWGLLKVSPLASLKALKAPDDARMRYLSTAEEKRLRQALETLGTPDYLKVAVLVSINTGLRRGELLGLDWSAVNLETRLLTVTARTAKSSKVRHIPLNSEVLQVLTDWQKKGEGTGPVFGLGDIKKSWCTLRDLAELQDFRWHDLRHSFASKLVQNGVDLNVVRELLGHADIRMTLRYAHLAPEHKASAVEVLCNG